MTNKLPSIQNIAKKRVLSSTQILRRFSVPSMQGSMEELTDEAAELRTSEKLEEAAELRAAFAIRLEKALDLMGYPRKNYGRNVQLARDLGISQPQAFKLLNGAIPPALTLKKLTVVANASIDYLLGVTNEIHPAPDSFVDRHGHDDAIVKWHWRPEGDIRTEFEVPVPKAVKLSGMLKAFWAERRETQVEDQRELVIYDPTVTTLSDKCEFLVTINGTEQIRLVKMNKGHAILLFQNNTLPLTVPVDTMTDGFNVVVVLGRIYFRTVVPHRRFK